MTERYKGDPLMNGAAGGKRERGGEKSQASNYPFVNFYHFDINKG